MILVSLKHHSGHLLKRWYCMAKYYWLGSRHILIIVISDLVSTSMWALYPTDRHGAAPAVDSMKAFVLRLSSHTNHLNNERSIFFFATSSLPQIISNSIFDSELRNAVGSGLFFELQWKVWPDNPSCRLPMGLMCSLK